MLKTGELAGIEGAQPLFAIEGGGLVAAVSRVPSAVFGEEPLNELVRDLPRLTPYVLRHEEAIRALFAAAPAVVPMSFGAVYREEAGVADLLRSEAKRLSALLDALRGKQEWGVKVFAEADPATAAAQASSAALRAIDEEMKAAAPGRAYLLQRKRDEVLAGEVRSFVAEALESVIDELVPESADARLDDVPSGQQGTAELVLKAAFLVDQDRVAGFEQIAAGLIERLGPIGLAMEVSGPWAPYSFTGARE